MCSEVNAGPSVRVMIRPPPSDMLSRRNISRAFREREALIREAPERPMTLVADGLAARPPQVGANCGRSHHHLRQHNHSLSEAVIRVTATSEQRGAYITSVYPPNPPPPNPTQNICVQPPQDVNQQNVFGTVLPLKPYCAFILLSRYFL